MPATSKLDDLVVVLVRPRNPLNIGAAARAMCNFGAHRLRLVNPYAAGFREARSAVGAVHLLKSAEVFKTVADAVADCALVVGTTAVRDRALQHPVRQLSQESGSEICAQLQAGRVALLFGSEKIGLTNDDFSYCHWLLTIPTREQQISMNLGQAVAVCLYELARHASSVLPVEEREPAATGEIEKITGLLFESLQLSGYVKPGTHAMFEKRLRRVMLRLNLQKLDAKVLLGMARQIVWKLRQGKN
ncbi:MAG TPA: TrmH family RNA methyltransferase [Candidatus Dormibacteraeota bacterium]|nr:TrmH family RNA methyltransferase [Candidatus Dormibacteraeota bacterium]